MNRRLAAAVGTGMRGTRLAASGQARQTAPSHWAGLALRIAGAGLLAATAAIHLDLYLTGYRSIPTIGWLFLLQVIAAFGLAGLVAVSGSWLATAAGAGFALATLGGYLLSVWVGLFGFKEVRTTAGIVAGVIEVAAFAALAAATLMAASRAEPGRLLPGPAGRLAARLQTAGPAAATAVAGVSVIALVLLGTAAAGAGGQGPAPAAGRVQTATIGGVRVLTNSRGLTLYWFAPDTATTSACYGSCAAYWPPVKGPAAAGPGVPGKFGTIKRSDGSLQATYDGHPLYTYIADSGPGQAHGNNINLNGGLWHEVAAQ
jgi:predicted lipoprotein with Yx(FWY)xxD motif